MGQKGLACAVAKHISILKMCDFPLAYANGKFDMGYASLYIEP
jgi:hypothetical protein